MPDEPWGVVGDRSALITRQQNLRGQITASPTGRNLLSGSPTVYMFDTDPTGTVGSWPDGSHGSWVDGSDLVYGVFTRGTGWKSVTLA